VKEMTEERTKNEKEKQEGKRMGVGLALSCSPTLVPFSWGRVFLFRLFVVAI
jgi:hypothetical protein